MNQMLKLASLSGVALGILSTVAVAADLPSRRAPAPYLPPPPIFTWTGFYAGLNAGAMFLTNNNNNNSAFTNALLFPGTPFLGFGNNNGNRTAFIGGGQVGYNWQTGPVVFGLEVDAQGHTKLGNSGNNGFFGGGNNSNGGGFLGTARGRLGYAFTPAFMIYATGGAAFGNTFSGNAANPFFLGFGNNNNNNFRVGYAVGGGLEYMISPNWSIKGEYLFVDLGRNSVGNNFFFGGSGNRSQAHVARLGVNYHFSTYAPAPVVARY